MSTGVRAGARRQRPSSRTSRARASLAALVAGASIAGLTMGLSGCAQAVLPEANIASPGFGSDASGTVTVWARAATVTSDQQLADDFNATHHGLTVKVAVIPDTQYVTKLATAIRSGNVPDAVDMDDVNSTLFAYHDAMTNLTPLVKALPYYKYLSPGHLNLGSINGQIDAVPLAADVSVLFYNKTLFKRAGLNPDDPPHDYAQVLADAKKISALGHGISGFEFPADNAGFMCFTGFPGMWSDGGHIISGALGHQKADIAGNQALADMLSFYRQMWQDKLVPVGTPSQGGATYGPLFLNGQIGMMPGSYSSFVTSGASASFLKQVGAVPLTGTKGQIGGFAGGDNIGIPRGAKNPSGAWEFIQFALSAQEQARLPLSGFTPVRSDVATPAWQRKYPLSAVSEVALQHSAMDKTIAWNVLINQQSGPFLQLFTTAVFGTGNVDIASLLRSRQHQFTQVLDAAQT